MGLQCTAATKGLFCKDKVLEGVGVRESGPEKHQLASVSVIIAAAMVACEESDVNVSFFPSCGGGLPGPP